MHSFKRLSPYVGPNIPEQVRELAKGLFRGPEVAGGWQRDGGSGTFGCELLLCDQDSETEDPAGYIAVVPMQDGIGYAEADYEARGSRLLEPGGKEPGPPQGPIKACCIRCCLHGEKFRADEQFVSSKLFGSLSAAKAFLDLVLAFATPEIPPLPATQNYGKR
jgi:hypothetical protein